LIKLRRDSIFRKKVRSKPIRLIEEAKVEAFEISENIPRRRKKTHAQRGDTTAIRSGCMN
jgi:hypothetical protein